MKEWQKFLGIFLVSLLPFITLLIRGVGWGNDSFAFYAVSCGKTQFVNSIGSSFFAQFLPLLGCNFFLTSLIMYLVYFLSLLSIYIIAKKVLGEHAWLLPVYLGSLTPLFFLEGLRFENDLFGWATVFLSVALFQIGLKSKKRVLKALVFVLCVVMALISLQTWQFSIIILAMCVLLLDLPSHFKDLAIISMFVVFSILFFDYILVSFQINPLFLIAEEIPLIGLVYILHIVHFYKNIPQPFFLYGLGLLAFGMLKSKYLFLATPFLLMALIKKEKSTGLWLESKRFKKKIEIKPIVFVIVFGIGFVISGVSLYPQQSDFVEMQEIIVLSKDNNVPLYNEWGSGWFFEYLGFETNYKVSYPDPDWNRLDKPFYAYSRIQDLNCSKINKNSYIC